MDPSNEIRRRDYLWDRCRGRGTMSPLLRWDFSMRAAISRRRSLENARFGERERERERDATLRQAYVAREEPRGEI